MITYEIEVHEGEHPEYQYTAVFAGYDGASDSDDMVGLGDSHGEAIMDLLEISRLEDEKE